MVQHAYAPDQENGALEDFMFYEVPDKLVAQKPAVPAES